MKTRIGFWTSLMAAALCLGAGIAKGVGSPAIAFVSAYATAPGSALLTGSLTSTGMAETVVGVAYGTTDGGEVMGAWDVTSQLGAGPFTVFPTACMTTVSVASGETYYCRFWASNSLGVAWSYQVGKWMAGEVWVAGADASANEGGSPAVITLGRPGWATNSALQVSYSMSGTAQNGTDYTALNGLATFAVGATNATVSISAGNDARFEGPETATLTLAGGAYAVGAPSQATVTINDAQKARFVAKFGSNTSPYDTWAKASTTIQPAVTAAAIGDLILVSNGVYTAAGTGYIVTVDKAVTMQSLNGPAVTTIDPLVGTTSTDRRCLSVTVAGALVSGFTLQGLYYLNSPTTICAVNLSAGTVTNCVIRNNRTIGGVGGAAVSGTGRLVDCVVSNNLCTEWQNGRGGGIFLSSANAVVERCLISGNEAQTYFGAGGVYLTAGTLRNCVITRNRAPYQPLLKDPATQFGKGAGVYMSNGRVENCTVSGNTSVDKGAGIYMANGSVSNSIIRFNTASQRFDAALQDFYSAAGLKGRNCYAGATGAGNVPGDPQFANAAGNDYTLLPGSPCLDAAATLATFANDRNGTARPIGAAWDMGAYETSLPANQPFTCNFSAPVTEALSGLTADFTAYVAGANTTITSYRWQFGDGSESAGAALSTVSHTYTTGWFTVTLTVSNALGQVASRTKTDYIKANPTDLYVNTTGSNTFPFNTLAKAAHTIASAVAAAPNSAAATVWVSDGTWAMPGQVVIEKAVTVRSVNGPTNCTTTVPAQKRSFYMHHPAAVVAGFTLTTSGTGDHYMDGGGVYLVQGTVTNCIFRNIVVGGRGAAIYMIGGRVVDCHIRDNRTYEWQYGYGGGIYIEVYTGYGNAFVENCRIERNESQSKWGGGSVYMNRGTLRNNLIVSNRATRAVLGTEGVGGGVRMAGGYLENCTVTRNFSVASGGGVYLSAVAPAYGYVTNSIVQANTVSIAPAGERNFYSSGGVVGYSCIDPAPVGVNNTAEDPQFVDAAALNFRLKTASPCVDKGRNATWMTGAVDLNRAVRRQNGTVDMGCYESLDPWSGPLIAGFSATPSSGFVSQQVVFTAEPVGLDTNIVSYSWTFGDGHSVAGAGRPVVTNTYAAGYYDVRLILQNQGGEVVTNSRLGYIKIAPAVAYVSLNGTAVAPYMTWGTAAHTLQDALTVVGHGDAGAHTIVAVTSGVYTVGAEIALSSENTILGVGPVSNVVIQGSSSASRLFNLSSSAATLSGLTIRGGYNESHLYDGGGIYITAGLVTNCIIRNNRAGGAGGGVYQSGGLVTHCLFRDNYASEHNYARGGGLFIQGGMTKDCTFDNNRAWSLYGGGGVFVNGGTVRNCLLTRNYSDRDSYSVYGLGGGAVVAAGLLESCTVATNWARINGGGIYMTGGIVSNTIVADNYVTVSGATNWHNPMASVGYCLSPDLPANPAKGNIAGRPVFENAAALDFRLARNSLGLDTGKNQGWMTGARDLVGSPRVWLSRWPRVALQDTVDMGCYELILPPQGSMMILR
jgi:hypothetical protein